MAGLQSAYTGLQTASNGLQNLLGLNNSTSTPNSSSLDTLANAYSTNSSGDYSG